MHRYTRVRTSRRRSTSSARPKPTPHRLTCKP
jgi:hypothetical protein